MTFVEVREDKAFKAPNGSYDVINQSIIDYREYYSKEYFDHLFLKLGITDEDQRYEFIQAVCHGASLYEGFKGLNREENTQQFQKDRLRKLQTALKKSKNALNDISENFAGYPMFLIRKLKKNIKDRSIKKDFITKKIQKTNTHRPFPDEYINHLVSHIDFILEATKEIENENLHLDRSIGRTALARWINEIGETWTRCSDIPFITGAYYKNAGYNSEAIIMLVRRQSILDTVHKNIRCASGSLV